MWFNKKSRVYDVTKFGISLIEFNYYVLIFLTPPFAG